MELNLQVVRNIAIAVIALLAVWYIFNYSRSDRKLPVSKAAELLAHLKSLNLSEAVFSSDELEDKWAFISGAHTLARVRLENLEFSHIEILSWGRHVSADKLWMDYVFPFSTMGSKPRLKETRLMAAKSHETYWKGDSRLEESLNQSEALNQRIEASGLSDMFLSVIPEPLFARSRVRVVYRLPSVEQLEILRDLARQVNEIW
jgi:hypothetical protein